MANLDKSAGVAGGPLGTLAGRGCWGTAGDTGWQGLLGDRWGHWLAGVAGGPLGPLAGRGCWGTAGATSWQGLLGDRWGH